MAVASEFTQKGISRWQEQFYLYLATRTARPRESAWLFRIGYGANRSLVCRWPVVAKLVTADRKPF